LTWISQPEDPSIAGVFFYRGRLYCRMMRPLSILCVLASLLSACTAPLPAATPLATIQPVPLTGEWLGGFVEEDGTVLSLLLNFSEGGGSLNIQPLLKSWEMSDLVYDGTQVSFSVLGGKSDPFEALGFEGEYANEGFAGDLDWNGHKYPVEFSALAQVETSTLEKYVGVYRFDSGRTVSVLLCPAYDDGRLQYFPPGLMFTDLASGDSRGLYPLENSTFGIGSARVLAYPLEPSQIKFMLDVSGQAAGLQSTNTTDLTKIETASRINYSVEDVKFTSADGAVMAGLLTSPKLPALHPVFMMLHGSEAGIKDGFGQQILAHYMVSQGIALLTYDKRGVGDSDGVYRESADTANIKLIASDAVAGADYLSTRPEIAAERIGLIGGSQAGWVIPLAAGQSKHVNFIVIFSGPVVSFAQEDHYSSITDDGDSATTYDAAKLDQTLRDMAPGGVNPIPVLATLAQPGLWLWGSVDKNVPFQVSAENLQGLIDSGRNNFSYAILPNGDHNLNESAHGYFAEIPYSPRVLYFSRLTEWLAQNVLTSNK
jgi:uncharacterized protein